MNVDVYKRQTYNGTLTIKNASGHVLATMKVSMTKVLPTTIPAGFSDVYKRQE